MSNGFTLFLHDADSEETPDDLTDQIDFTLSSSDRKAFKAALWSIYSNFLLKTKAKK